MHVLARGPGTVILSYNISTERQQTPDAAEQCTDVIAVDKTYLVWLEVGDKTWRAQRTLQWASGPDSCASVLSTPRNISGGDASACHDVQAAA